MSIKDLEIIRTREDGKEYKTTLGTMQEDAEIQSEKLKKEQLRKAKWAKWRDKWLPRIIKAVAIIGIMFVLGIVLYYLFWIILAGIILMAVGSGVSEAGREGQARAQHYNQRNRDWYWRK